VVKCQYFVVSGKIQQPTRNKQLTTHNEQLSKE